LSPIYPIFWLPSHATVPGIDGIVSTHRDVTWRRQAEANLRLAQTLVEQSPTVLFRCRASEGWPVDYVSENVRQWGYNPAELLSDAQPYAELIHPDDLARIKPEVAAHATSAATQLAKEYPIIKPSGEIIWVDDRTIIERNSAGT
jgi:PAS domain-containing protein